MSRRLGRIDDERNPRLSRNLPDLADRLNRACYVADVGDRDQLRIGANGFANILRIDQAARAFNGDAGGREPTVIFHCLERAKDGVVVDLGADRMALPARINQSFESQIESVRAVEIEDKVLGSL